MTRILASHIGRTALAALLWVAAAPSADAVIIQSPDTVRSVAARASGFTASFLSSDGVAFTVGEGSFCTALLDDTTGEPLAQGAPLTARPVRCEPGSVVGRVRAPRITAAAAPPPVVEMCGGEPCGPVPDPVIAGDGITAFSERVAVSIGTARRADRALHRIGRSEFYFVRDFTPASGGDLGAGLGASVGIGIALRPSGGLLDAPLTVTRSELFGTDRPGDARRQIIRLETETLPTGQVFAELETAGRGILSGWWEVRTPGDPALAERDLLAEGDLSPEDRAARIPLQRVARFRTRASVSGRTVIPGPRYGDLPRDLAGRHELLLRFDSRFRGSTAVPIEPIAYYAPAGDARRAFRFAPILAVAGDGEAARVNWRIPNWARDLTALATVTDPVTGNRREIVAPLRDGRMDVPADWLANGAAEVTFQVYDPLQRPVTESAAVARPADE